MLIGVAPTGSVDRTRVATIDALEIRVWGDSFLIYRRGTHHRLHRRSYPANHLVPDPLLVGERSDRGSKSDNIDDLKPAVGLDERSRTFTTVLVHEPELAHR
ncbi:MAG: hypothetical protein ACR2QO_00965 [Acidimicrobiales bacterium]